MASFKIYASVQYLKSKIWISCKITTSLLFYSPHHITSDMQTVCAALCCSARPLSERSRMLWQLNEHNIHFLLAFLYSKGYFLLYAFGKEEDESSSLVDLVGFMVISIKYLVSG